MKWITKPVELPLWWVLLAVSSMLTVAAASTIEWLT